MAIQDIDPDEFQEIIKTDTITAAIFTQDAIKKYEDELDKSIVIKVEGMELHLVGYGILGKRDESTKANMYLKINQELGQLQFAVSDHDDAEQVRQELFPIISNFATLAGLTLIDVRSVAAEALGMIKREKGVTTNEELMEIMKQESGSEENCCEITMKPEVDQYAL